MASQVFSNYPSSTLNGAITAGATSLTVNSTVGFPTSGNFQILIDQNEICQVTAVAGAVYTVTRAYEAISGVQTAFAHANGAPVVLVLTTQGLNLGFVRGDGPGQTPADGFGLRINPSVTADANTVGDGLTIYPTLTAHANNDILRGTAFSVGANPITAATGTYTGLSLQGVLIDGASFVKTGTGTITNAYSLQITTPTIGTNNYAATFMGGNVGIGTTSPVNLLHVAGAAAASGTLTLSGNASTNYTYVSAPGAAGAIVLGSTVGDLALRVAGGQNVHLDASGGATTTFKISAGNHIVGGGNAPTLGALQTGIASQSVSGTDTRGIITLTTTGAPPAANTLLCTLTWATAYGARPYVVFGQADTLPGGATIQWIGAPSTTLLNLYASAALAGTATYTISYVVVG